MNFRTWTKGKKILAAFIAIFFLVGIAVTVYLVQRQQEIRSHAQKATVLSLAPPNQSVAVNSNAKLDVLIDPGVNQVNYIKFTVKFDPTKFDSPSVTFTPNPSSPMQLVQPPTIAQGQITVILGVGNDPTKVIQTLQNLGSLTLTAGVQNNTQEPDLILGPTDITFDESQSQVRSVGSTDAFNENVLQSVVNAKVTITSGICRPNISTCYWDSSDGATSYHYQIKEKDSATTAEGTIIKEGDTSDTSVDFNSIPGKTYECHVVATNQCGSSSEFVGSSTCPVPSVTPVPSISLTPTPGPSSTPTPSPTPPIPTEVISTPTPTPTTPVVEVVTATPIPTNVIVQGPTLTPRPTLPATGNPVVYGGIVGGVLFVLGGLALLLL